MLHLRIISLEFRAQMRIASAEKGTELGSECANAIDAPA
jgi:hypothetical protein